MTPDELRLLRKAAGLTQRDLAQVLFVARNTVTRWECGRIRISRPMALLINLTIGSTAL